MDIKARHLKCPSGLCEILDLVEACAYVSILKQSVRRTADLKRRARVLGPSVVRWLLCEAQIGLRCSPFSENNAGHPLCRFSLLTRILSLGLSTNLFAFPSFPCFVYLFKHSLLFTDIIPRKIISTAKRSFNKNSQSVGVAVPFS